MSDLSELLKKRRAELGVTIPEIAGRLRMNKATVSNWENAKKVPSACSALNIADAYRLPLNAVVTAIANSTPANPNRTPLGDLIRHSRMLHGWNVPQLATKIGSTENTVYAWESGIAKPGKKIIEKLVKALDIPPAEYRRTAEASKRRRMRYYVSFECAPDGRQVKTRWWPNEILAVDASGAVSAACSRIRNHLCNFYAKRRMKCRVAVHNSTVTVERDGKQIYLINNFHTKRVKEA